MITGMLGNVTFEVTDETVRTISSLSRSNKANYSTHNLVGKKALVEFTGSDPEQISFEALFSAWLGVNPETWRTMLEDIMEKGTVVNFILGTWPVGYSPWVIESLSFSCDKFYKDGTPAEYKATVGLKEYV